MKFLEVKIDSLQDCLVVESTLAPAYEAIEKNIQDSLAGFRGALLAGDKASAQSFVAKIADSAEQADDLLAAKAVCDAFRAALVVEVPADPVPAPVPVVVEPAV